MDEPGKKGGPGESGGGGAPGDGGAPAGDAAPAGGLILHLAFPLSPRRDEYLPFPPLKGGAGPCAAYVAALVEELGAAAPDFAGYSLRAVRLDGAIPSMMSGSQLRDVMRAVHRGFALEGRPEFCLKIAPRLMSADLLASADSAFKLALDIDFVSAEERELAALQAPFNYGCLQDMMELVRCFGIGEFGFALRYGLPCQTPASLAYSIDRALDLGAPRVSLTPFVPLEGSRTARLAASGELPLPDEEGRAGLLEAGREHLAEAGLGEYAPGRFCLPGREDAYTELYAGGCALLGAGLGARSRFEDMELVNTGDFAAYVGAPADPAATVAESRICGAGEDAREAELRLRAERLRGVIAW